jgi:hypothetical protein
MTIVAIARKGTEFLYRASTAHKVPKSSAKMICDALNKVGFMLTEDSEIWHVYTDIPEWSNAGAYASTQAFRRHNNQLQRVR